jgi:Protein of unknown function (DUF2510)
MATPTMVPAGWYTDPAHRHEYRYWSGADWTPLVSDKAVTATDPLQSPVPQSPVSPPSAPVLVSPPPAAASVPPPVPAQAPPPAPVPAPSMAAQPIPAIDPRLSAAVAEYSKRRYKILMGTGGTVTMERPASRFNWLIAVALIILFGVGVFVYVAIWAIWGVHRSYRVMLSLGPQGEVQEAGDVLALYDQDHLKANRKRSFGFGIFFAAVAGIWAAGAVGAAVTAATGQLTIGLVNGILAIAVGAVAFLLFRSARKTAQKLEIASGHVVTPSLPPVTPQL